MRMARFSCDRDRIRMAPRAATMTPCVESRMSAGDGAAGRPSRRAQVLLVAPLPAPPLLGGIETGVALHLQSDLARRVPTRLFNTAREKDPTRRTYQRLLYQLKSCARFVATVCLTRPKIVHIKSASGINFYQSAVYGLLARLLGRRVLLQLHAGDFPSFYSGAGRLGRAVIGIGLRLPHGLIALSPHWERYFRSLARSQSIAIIPNATQTDRFFLGRPDRPRFGLASENTILLFMGTRSVDMDREKGLPELVQAVARVRQRHPELLLALAGRHSHRELLTASLGPEGKGWAHLGTVSGEDKPALFRSVDIFVLPAMIENVPDTVVDAIAAG